MLSLQAARTARLSTAGGFPIENAPARGYNDLYGRWQRPAPLVEQMSAYGCEIGPHRDEHDYIASVTHQGRGVERGRREIPVGV